MDAWYPKAGKGKDWLTIFVGIIALCMVVQLFANVALISATITLKNQVAIRAKK